MHDFQSISFFGILIIVLILQIYLLTKIKIPNANFPDESLNAVKSDLRMVIDMVRGDLSRLKEDLAQQSRDNKADQSLNLKGLNDSLTKQAFESNSSIEMRLDRFRESLESKTNISSTAISSRIEKFEEEVKSEFKLVGQDLLNGIEKMNANILQLVGEVGGQQKTQMIEMKSENIGMLTQLKSDISKSLDESKNFILQGFTSISESQRHHHQTSIDQIRKLEDTNQKKLDQVRSMVEEKLKAIQEDNTLQLNQMRQTVDEKLQGTLERRLTESFKLVSERLELVHKGLGEMQTLANGVGDLKRVLTNVKTRGTWGEVQLGALLDQILTKDQFLSNVSPKNNSDRIEFAIKMPGRSVDSDDVVLLPIDAKFPIEDYQRLIEAQEKADLKSIEESKGKLEIRIKQSAQSISEKYLMPPKTTEFGILYLPTEGLFAEVLRIEGLTDDIQRNFRIVVAGPTTLWSILNSLQMGFRTLAIEKRSADVWKLLSAVKTEWSNYGEALSKVQKKLQEASNSIDRAAVRSRAIGKQLKDVQQLENQEHKLLVLPEIHEAESDDDEEIA